MQFYKFLVPMSERDWKSLAYASNIWQRISVSRYVQID